MVCVVCKNPNFSGVRVFSSQKGDLTQGKSSFLLLESVCIELLNGEGDFGCVITGNNFNNWLGSSINYITEMCFPLVSSVSVREQSNCGRTSQVPGWVSENTTPKACHN